MTNLYKNWIKSIAGISLLLGVLPAFAADKELLDILLGNGSITQEQYDSLLAKEELTKEDAAQISFGNGSGLKVESGDGEYAVEVGGRLHMDYVDHSYDARMGQAPVSGTQIRRGRIEFDGIFNKNWGWAAEFDFAKNRTDVKDFKLGYVADNGASLYIGNQKQPYSLSLEMSSNDIPFVERSIDNVLVAPFTDRALGARAEYSGSNWFVAGGLFGESMNPSDGEGDEGWGTSARAVYAPVLDEQHVVHLGLRYAYRELDTGSAPLSVRDKTSDFSDLNIVNTGTLGDAEAVTLFGPEFGLAMGPLYVFGEYNEAAIELVNASDADLSSWHVGTALTLTGESRAARYSIGAGEFKNLRPESQFNLANGTLGLVEVAARYASINLNDGVVQGGEEDTVSLALNWQPNNNVRLMFDWTRILDTDGSNTIRQFAPDMDIFTFRTQYNY